MNKKIALGVVVSLLSVMVTAYADTAAVSKIEQRAQVKKAQGIHLEKKGNRLQKKGDALIASGNVKAGNALVVKGAADKKAGAWKLHRAKQLNNKAEKLENGVTPNTK